MKIYFAIVYSILISSQILAQSEIENFNQKNYYLVESNLDTTLLKTEAVIRIRFDEITVNGSTILYSIDGAASQATINNGSLLYFKTTPGKHKFQFFYNGKFHEAYVKINIKAQHSEIWNVRFIRPVIKIDSPIKRKPHDIQPLKPVIYLYPQEETNVFVNVKPIGDFTLTYPEIGDGWNVSAKPNGDLSINGEKYNYLFWESNQRYDAPLFQASNGFIVKGSSIISFLEEKLNIAGLNSKEQADFITFWAPRMMHHESVYVHFDFNNDCDKYASLEIIPKPDFLYRIFMTWTPTNGLNSVKEQTIPKMKRKGFTVLEWGGAKIPSIEKNQAYESIK